MDIWLGISRLERRSLTVTAKCTMSKPSNKGEYTGFWGWGLIFPFAVHCANIALRECKIQTSTHTDGTKNSKNLYLHSLKTTHSLLSFNLQMWNYSTIFFSFIEKLLCILCKCKVIYLLNISFRLLNQHENEWIVAWLCLPSGFTSY